MARASASLSRELPGQSAQRVMAPVGRELPKRFERPDDARIGSVLLLLYPCEGRPHLLLTRRPTSMPNHGGQISLPGGAREGCEALVTTALRESHEELGIATHEVRVLGALTPIYIPVSRFCVHPFLGWLDSPPQFRPNPQEVDELIHAPTDDLIRGDVVERESRVWRGSEVEVPFYRIGEHKVWGATAMILAEWVALHHI